MKNRFVLKLLAILAIVVAAYALRPASDVRDTTTLQLDNIKTTARETYGVDPFCWYCSCYVSESPTIDLREAFTGLLRHQEEESAR